MPILWACGFEGRVEDLLRSKHLLLEFLELCSSMLILYTRTWRQKGISISSASAQPKLDCITVLPLTFWKLSTSFCDFHSPPPQCRYLHLVTSSRLRHLETLLPPQLWSRHHILDKPKKRSSFFDLLLWWGSIQCRLWGKIGRSNGRNSEFWFLDLERSPLRYLELGDRHWRGYYFETVSADLAQNCRKAKILIICGFIGNLFEFTDQLIRPWSLSLCSTPLELRFGTFGWLSTSWQGWQVFLYAESERSERRMRLAMFLQSLSSWLTVTLSYSAVLRTPVTFLWVWRSMLTLLLLKSCSFWDHFRSRISCL